MIVLRRTTILAVYSALLFVFSGCGDKTVVAPSSTKLEESQTCIDCHSSKQSPVTSKYISEEWKLSVHNTKNNYQIAVSPHVVHELSLHVVGALANGPSWSSSTGRRRTCSRACRDARTATSGSRSGRDTGSR